jgi:hypothetical protein
MSSGVPCGIPTIWDPYLILLFGKSTITESFDFSIFGSEGSIKEIKPILFYKIPKSKAEFTKESNSLSIVLKSAPVIINVKVHLNV